MTNVEKATPLQELLEKLCACQDAREWAGDMSIEEVVEKCHRGDWLLWLASRVGVEKRLMVHAGGLCAGTVRHLMQDEGSLKAVDTCIAYGKGEATAEQLSAARDAARAAAWDAARAAAWAAAGAAARAAAVAAAGAAAVAAARAAARAAALDAALDAARKANQLLTADIARKLLGPRIIELVKDHLQSL